MDMVFLFLLAAIVFGFLSKRTLAIAMFLLSVIFAFTNGMVDYIGLSAVVVFYTITYFYFNRKMAYPVFDGILFVSMLAVVVLFNLHKVPGFNNVLVLDKVNLSPHSIPFSMYLNFDKSMASFILFLNSGLWLNEKRSTFQSWQVTFKGFFVSVAIMSTLALIMGVFKFDPKYPSFLPIWIVNNLFFVCFAEEVFFRGVIQNKLQKTLKNPYLALAGASLLFGLAHIQGGIAYVIFATIAGMFYGLVYQKTGRLHCAIVTHFGINLVHLLFFTYPAAIK